MPQYLPFGALQENSHAGVGKQSKAGLLIVKREVGQNRGGFVGNLERSARQQGFEVLRKDADRFLSRPCGTDCGCIVRREADPASALASSVRGMSTARVSFSMM